VEGVETKYVREEVLDPFFRNFWVRRLALEPRSSRQVLDTTEALSVKVGGADVVRRIVEVSIIVPCVFAVLFHDSFTIHTHTHTHTLQDLKDASEPYRKMVMTAVDRVFTKLGAADIDGRLEEVLMDGVIYAFQEQVCM
jgi:splicing factor 3B subunit 1